MKWYVFLLVEAEVDKDGLGPTYRQAATEGKAASHDEALRRVDALVAALAPFVGEATQ